MSCASSPQSRQSINADSMPFKDAGTPLAGSFKNGQRIKGGAYLAATLLTLACSLLFVPIQDDGRSVIPIDDRISIPISLGVVGLAASIALIASPIDTAISYHTRNKKILELNAIEWKAGKTTKYQAILDHRIFLKQQEIEGFRKKFLLNTITDRDIYIISSDEEMAEALKLEVEMYIEKRNKIKNDEVEH